MAFKKDGSNSVQVRSESLFAYSQFSLSSPVLSSSVAAESWGLSLNPRQAVMATAGNEGKVKVLSASTEDFGNELATLDASGSFGSAVRYVSNPARAFDHEA